MLAGLALGTCTRALAGCLPLGSTGLCGEAPDFERLGRIDQAIPAALALSLTLRDLG
jgi:hypothetical protein